MLPLSVHEPGDLLGLKKSHPMAGQDLGTDPCAAPRVPYHPVDNSWTAAGEKSVATAVVFLSNCSQISTVWAPILLGQLVQGGLVMLLKYVISDAHKLLLPGIHCWIVSKPRYFTITKSALHAMKLCIKIHLYFCPPDRKLKDFLGFPITFSWFGANPTVLRQFNAPLIILEAVWELCTVTTTLLIPWKAAS